LKQGCFISVSWRNKGGSDDGAANAQGKGIFFIFTFGILIFNVDFY